MLLARRSVSWARNDNRHAIRRDCAKPPPLQLIADDEPLAWRIGATSDQGAKLVRAGLHNSDELQLIDWRGRRIRDDSGRNDWLGNFDRPAIGMKQWSGTRLRKFS